MWQIRLFTEISYIYILLQLKLKTIDEIMFKIITKITRENDVDTNTEFSPKTLNDNLFCGTINQNKSIYQKLITQSQLSIY